MNTVPHSAACLLVLVLLGAGTVRAQTPSGTITGTTKDPAGAVLAGVHVTITNRETGESRVATSSADGSYSAAVLRPGEYRVTAHVDGFKRVEKTASVEAGTTTSVDLMLELGAIEEIVSVPGVQPLIRSDDHAVSGVVTRGQIEALPLNGRTFLELTKLEPGTTNPSRFGDGRVFVAPLGAGLNTIPRVGHTRVTVDGANITTPGTSGVLFQISQDVVQEFQISTANFDQATSLTTSGAINVVTRSGGNKYQGSGVYIHRDHRLAAYPALRRDPDNPDPVFRRRQIGSYAGGPLVRDRAFLFAAYERTDQQAAVSVQPSTPAFAHLGGIFPSPYDENQVSARADVRLHRNHHAFGRYTYDGSHGHVGGGTLLPSAWGRRTNQADQSLVALTMC